jgi:hypothetical protein
MAVQYIENEIAICLLNVYNRRAGEVYITHTFVPTLYIVFFLKKIHFFIVVVW